MEKLTTNLPAQLTTVDVNKLANTHSGCVNFGPLCISWNLDLSYPRIIVDSTLYGTPIGHEVIDTTHPTACFGGNLGVAKAEAELTANFDERALDYKVEVSVIGNTIVNKCGLLFTW
jgi:hypothetical protein